MRDPSAEAAAIQIAAFRNVTPPERVAVDFEAGEGVMVVARAPWGGPNAADCVGWF